MKKLLYLAVIALVAVLLIPFSVSAATPVQSKTIHEERDKDPHFTGETPVLPKKGEGV
jgi:hypothetical protein